MIDYMTFIYFISYVKYYITLHMFTFMYASAIGIAVSVDTLGLRLVSSVSV